MKKFITRRWKSRLKIVNLFFKKRCGADANLRREVESLLSFEKTFDEFIDAPPASLAAEMFASLEKAYAGRDFQMTDLKVEPGYDPLRDDPRFQDLPRRAGFPPL